MSDEQNEPVVPEATTPLTAEQTQANYASEVAGLNTGAGVKPKRNWLVYGVVGLVSTGLVASEGNRLYERWFPVTAEESVGQSGVDTFQNKTASRLNVDTPIEAVVPAPDPVVVEKVVSFEDREALAALRLELKALKDAKLTDAQLAKLVQEKVDANAKALRAEHDRKLLALENAQKLKDAKAEAALKAAQLASAQLSEEERLADARRRQLEADRQAAKELRDRQVHSKMLVGASSGSGSANASDIPGAGDDSHLSADERFLANGGDRSYEPVIGKELPFQSNTVAEGTFIHAALETAINSSLPGSIRAVVTSDVYSMNGRAVLMPKGTRLIGSYRSVTAITQKRALVVWTRAITPGGISVEMSASGADALGRGGLDGKVNTHFGKRFGTAALISIVTAIPAIAASESGASDGTQDAIEDVGGDFGDALGETMRDYLTIPPTVSVRQGDDIVVITSQNILIFG